MLTRTPQPPDFRRITTGELLALPPEQQAAYQTWLLNQWSGGAWSRLYGTTPQEQADYQADCDDARLIGEWCRGEHPP